MDISHKISFKTISNFCVKLSINLISSVYHSYSSEDEHAEIIVKYPQIIAEKCYDNEIVKKLYKPLANYYHNVVEKHIEEYINVHDTTTICPHVTMVDELDILYN